MRALACRDRTQELCESRGGHPGLPSLIVLMVRKATLSLTVRAQELCESRGGHPVSAEGVDERMINVYYYYYCPGLPSLIVLMVSIDVKQL